MPDGETAATALALGAQGVSVGRPVQWGLAADGARGVESVLSALDRDLARICGLLGACDGDELSPDLITLDATQDPSRRR
ncbi:alpha-hydroxy-acid oxidizing protein [uncultured Jatrophihabitans sp.]|uniref:alpha-hydroxy-acid oxidizing protein n=1 Tax=uncultured Jatrophihabitans sp. TaxID=1610747 RepID=UPI0035C9ED35